MKHYQKEKKSNNMDLTVLILARNEAQSLQLLIPQIYDALVSIPASYEILVVDGKSTDETIQICRQLGARVIIQEQLGYGSAFREGIEAAHGRYICNIDADGSHNPYYMRQLYSHRYEAPIIIGSRYCFQGYYHGQRFRHFLSWFLNKLFARVLSLPVADMSSGLRLYKRDVVAALPLTGCDFDVLEEVLVHIWANGYRAVEIPIHFHPREEGASKARLIHFGYSYIKMLYRLWKLRNVATSADYDDRAFNSPLLPQRWWQRSRYKKVLSFCKGKKGRVLDAGCGSSKILAAMPHAIGVDRNLKKLRFRQITNTNLLCGDCCRLPFDDASFDLVISSQVIEHLPNATECLDELTRVLVDGGFLVLGTPDYGRLIWKLTERLYHIILPHAYADEHVTCFSRKGLLNILKDRGFVIIDYTYVFAGELIVLAQRKTKK